MSDICVREGFTRSGNPNITYCAIRHSQRYSLIGEESSMWKSAGHHVSILKREKQARGTIWIGVLCSAHLCHNQ